MAKRIEVIVSDTSTSTTIQGLMDCEVVGICKRLILEAELRQGARYLEGEKKED
jgi:hypothetical protein